MFTEFIDFIIFFLLLYIYSEFIWNIFSTYEMSRQVFCLLCMWYVLREYCVMLLIKKKRRRNSNLLPAILHVRQKIFSNQYFDIYCRNGKMICQQKKEEKIWYANEKNKKKMIWYSSGGSYLSLWLSTSASSKLLNSSIWVIFFWNWKKKFVTIWMNFKD